MRFCMRFPIASNKALSPTRGACRNFVLAFCPVVGKGVPSDDWSLAIVFIVPRRRLIHAYGVFVYWFSFLSIKCSKVFGSESFKSSANRLKRSLVAGFTFKLRGTIRSSSGIGFLPAPLGFLFFSVTFGRLARLREDRLPSELTKSWGKL